MSTSSTPHQASLAFAHAGIFEHFSSGEIKTFSTSCLHCDGACILNCQAQGLPCREERHSRTSRTRNFLHTSMPAIWTSRSSACTPSAACSSCSFFKAAPLLACWAPPCSQHQPDKTSMQLMLSSAAFKKEWSWKSSTAILGTALHPGSPIAFPLQVHQKLGNLVLTGCLLQGILGPATTCLAHAPDAC